MVGMDSLKETVFYQVIYYLQGMHTKNKNEEINMMSSFIKKITSEIYNIYYLIKQNSELLNELPENYKSIIIYLNNLYEIKKLNMKL